jgi:hypothetical protein
MYDIRMSPEETAPAPVEGPRRTVWPYVLAVAVALLVTGLAVLTLVPTAGDFRPGGPQFFGGLREITSAQALFREQDADRDGALDYATSLAELRSANLIDAVLARGRKDGYEFKIHGGDMFTWSATASPIERDETGDRWGFIDESGVIRFSTTGPAGPGDREIGR